MENEKVEVDAQGKLELVDMDELRRSLLAPHARKTRAPKLPVRAMVDQQVAERAVQQEAELTIDCANARPNGT